MQADVAQSDFVCECVVAARLEVGVLDLNHLDTAIAFLNEC